MDTQTCLDKLAQEEPVSTDDSDDDEVVDVGGKRRKIFRNTRSKSLSQPSDTSLQLQIEDDNDMKTMLRMLKSMSTKFTAFKKAMTKDISTIKDDLKAVKEDVTELKNRNSHPLINPDNINDAVSIEVISQQIAGMETKINNIGDHIEEKAKDPVSHKKAHKDLKQTITLVKDVDDKINKRKKAFYDQHQLKDRIDIHKKWLAEDPPIIPAPFIPKYIQKEPQREYDIRKKQKLNELESKIQIWEFRAKEADEKIEFYDNLVKEEIEGSEKSEEEKEKEKTAWKNLVKIEEEKSTSIWDKKRKDILDQPKRQIDTKRIQTIEDKLYSTIVKSTTNTNNNHYQENENQWQTVSYKKKPRNQNNSYNNYGSRNFYWKKAPHRQKWY